MGVNVTPGVGAAVAADVVGTPSAPSTGQLVQYNKLDRGVTGSSDPVNVGNGLPVEVGVTAANGMDTYRRVSAATTNADTVKASPGTLYWIAGFNTNAATRFLKIYDKASNPVVGTDTPKITVALGANALGAAPVPAIPPQGIKFTLGIAVAITALPGDADTTAVAAGEQNVTIGFK